MTNSASGRVTPVCRTQSDTTTAIDIVESQTCKVFGTESVRENKGTYNLQAVDLSYKVVHKSKLGVKGVQVEEQTLLSNVTAVARHGEIMAVVGPSGAGKTTFLDAVAGRIRPSSLQGRILLNGKPVDSSFRRVSGYVMQDDQLFPHLTVRETLMFSARLRIPNTMSKAEKAARVEAVIQELGLSKCANTRIGNDQVRGVSGGEKRRVSIGVDLIHDPAVLFLDEPTSGLDSVSALTVVQILRDLAESRNRTVVMTIHQPSFRILELIHNFLVLSRGMAVYQGPYTGMADYFRKFEGKPMVELANGLEYALDVVENAQKSEEQIAALLVYAKTNQQAAEQHILEEVTTARFPFRCTSRRSVAGSEEAESSGGFATGFFSEVRVLLDRDFKNIFRTKELFLTRVFLFFSASIIVGSLFYKAPFTAKGVTDRVSVFAFCLMAFLFTAVEALPVFLEERQIYIRESSRGAYRTASYVLAGTIAFLPFLYLTALSAIIVPYFMVGLAPTFTAFLTFLMASFITLCVGNSFVLFIGGLVPNFASGVTVSTAIKAFFFLCSGFFIEASRIPKYWIWLNWLSTFKYPLKMMMLNEFTNVNACWAYMDGSDSICILRSPQVLAGYETEGEQIWIMALVMVAFFVGYRFLFYLTLKWHTASVRR